MQALAFNTAGEPSDVLVLTERPAPRPGPGEALIAVSARPIHPADLVFIRGRYRIQPAFPQVAGLEGVGQVAECPPDCGLRSGQRVAFRWPGSWAELTAAPTDRLLPVPDDIEDAEACQISLNPLTAWGLLQLSEANAGDCVLITAATSTVANLIAGLCRARGIRTIGVVRGQIREAASRASADTVLSAADPELTAKIIEQTGGEKVAALLDSVGGPLLSGLMSTLRPGGRILAYGVQDPAPAAITNAMLIYANLTWIGFGIDRWLAGLSNAERSATLEGLWAMIRERTLSLPVAGTFGLAQFREALASDAQSGRSGKVLLR